MILVKDFPEADPGARMTVLRVYKEAITGNMSERVRKGATSRLTLRPVGLNPTGETRTKGGRESTPLGEQHGMEQKIPKFLGMELSPRMARGNH